MKVLFAEICKGTINRRTRRITGLQGGVITFQSEESLSVGSVVSIHLNDMKRFFKIAEVSTTDSETLEYAAENYGYWGKKIDKIKDLDLRTLVDLPITLVTDKDQLKLLVNSSAFT